jgi:uncharacterized heparinase superfamily protein
MGRDWKGTLARGFSKPPHIIARRIAHEVTAESERFISPVRARRFTTRTLLRNTSTSSLPQLWQKLAARPFPALTAAANFARFDEICPGERERILADAERALRHEIDLLGSGPLSLGENIDWHKDHKTGFGWPPAYMRSIEYNNPDRPSDVKVPWETSRLQWLIPAGQAYLLTGDDRYAAGIRRVLESWIEANPYAHSVNWSCTMEAALRILSWSWFFHACHAAPSWADESFRSQFLRALYLHGDFTLRHLEYSDVNGNHCTADATGLVYAGLFFGEGSEPQSWLRRGWDLLCTELPRQVFADGVDFEASVPYHRLVAELFFFPALYRELAGLDVPASYRERVTSMARFSAAYSRLHGSCPLWGDADDARALPFGGQQLNDHRYFVGLVGAAWNVEELRLASAGPRGEAFWCLGAERAATLPATDEPPAPPASAAFADGGFYIMRSGGDHVFIDCGPLGLAGRGGHGHNDCLAFEATLQNQVLVSDCGAYLYTASYAERNNFRSTAYHNTPQVDGEEINRFIRPDYLWTMHNDAIPEVRAWQTGSKRDYFQGSHRGYQRLSSPVTPVRSIVLDHEQHALIWRDVLEGSGEHEVEIPLHLAPGVTATPDGDGQLRLGTATGEFTLLWTDAANWELRIEPARVSPGYGVVVPTTRLSWRRKNPLPLSFVGCIVPAQSTLDAVLPWAQSLLQEYESATARG